MSRTNSRVITLRVVKFPYTHTHTHTAIWPNNCVSVLRGLILHGSKLFHPEYHSFLRSIPRWRGGGRVAWLNFISLFVRIGSIENFPLASLLGSDFSFCLREVCFQNVYGKLEAKCCVSWKLLVSLTLGERVLITVLVIFISSFFGKCNSTLCHAGSTSKSLVSK